MQHFHVHLDLPYHSNESPTVLILFSGNSMMIRNGPIFDSATIGWDKTKLRMRLTNFLSSFEFNDITKLTNLAVSVSKIDISNEIN